MTPRALPVIPLEQVVRLWLHRQGLSEPQGSVPLDKTALVDHLERTGALQLDTVNAVERAHYLTLWSRFGPYTKGHVDRWVYRERAAYEYWGHEASLLPISHLPLGRRRMRRFPPPRLRERSWWPSYTTSTASKRRVLRRLRSEGPLESADFERRASEPADASPWGMPMPKEDTRSLKLLWHDGRVAVRRRRHFRCVYDLAERVYPEGPVASTTEFEDSWLLVGLSGNGVASERHLTNYFTGPSPTAAERKRIIRRQLAKRRVVEVRVQDRRGTFLALPEHLETIDQLPEPHGTTLVCPFDSLLWQRKRAEELLGFGYRVEIYVPAAKRQFGYYVMPILHDGRLVGRLDPKLHRDRGLLEIKAIYLEDGFRGGAAFRRGLAESLESLRRFLGADRLDLPARWRA
jgi:uncharacterized protein YcaQ